MSATTEASDRYLRKAPPMDHLADIREYSPTAKAEVVAAMEKTYRLVLN